MAGTSIPEGVSVLDGGTLGLHLLPYIEDAERVILVDAIRADGPAGSFVRLEGDDVGPAVAAACPSTRWASPISSTPRDGRADLPDELVLLGLVPETLELGVTLSPPVADGLPGLVDRVVEEVSRLGFDLHPRSQDEARDSDRSAC